MIDDRAIIEYLRRSYFVADGLWFTKLEEEHSYDYALRIDELVWEILAKIQARKARELLNIEGSNLADLLRALELKFVAESYQYQTIELTPSLLRIAINECPWLNILQKADKIRCALDICENVCVRDFAGWAAQFSPAISFTLGRTLATGESICELVFNCSQVVKTLPHVDAERDAAG